MAYTVLARKYRSQTFTEVIGQEPIATTLMNAIRSGRIHHGYLFTGTRGVGKTSMARILAKALNCLNAPAPTAEPCCKCDACVATAEGQDIDVLEIDAASNTGVDNIRELRSNTAFRPARGRFRTYIIDEVHMLSTGAFNALLKTLEEPPEHVKFILATTEIQKVPATIQSRCQRFNFRNISPEAIARRLEGIVQAEGASADAPVIQRVARLANGSMRDALSILDQLLSVSAEHLSAAALDELLPPAQDERIFALLEHAASGDAAAALGALDGIVAAGRGLEVFCQDAVEVARTLLLLRACGPDSQLVDLPAGGRDAYVHLAQQFELSHYVQMVGLLEELRRNVRFSSAGRALADAAIVRLARLRQWGSIEQLLSQLPAGSPASDEKKKPASQPVATADRIGTAAGATGANGPDRATRAAGPERRPEVAPERRPDAGPAKSNDSHTRQPAGQVAAKATDTRGPTTPASTNRPQPASTRASNTPQPTDTGSDHGDAYTEVPDDYVPADDNAPADYVPLDDADAVEPAPAESKAADARSPDARSTGQAARPRAAESAGRAGVSVADRAQVEADPVVHKALDLFDGIVVNVERRTPARAPSAE